MASTGLSRGMGSFFKECEHPESRWSMGTFDHKFVEAFIQSMERNGGGLGAQTNAFSRTSHQHAGLGLLVLLPA